MQRSAGSPFPVLNGLWALLAWRQAVTAHLPVYAGSLGMVAPFATQRLHLGAVAAVPAVAPLMVVAVMIVVQHTATVRALVPKVAQYLSDYAFHWGLRYL